MTRRCIARVSCVLLLAGVSLAATPAPAPAVSSLKVEAGYDGFVLPGRSFPVRVEARTDRLVRGRIEVIGRFDNGPGETVSVRLPVEIPGGGAKSFVVVVPPIPTFPGGSVGVQARLVEGDGGAPIAESARVQARPANDRELVGLLPAAWSSSGAGATGPATVPLAIDAGVAQFFEVDPILLELAPGSLEPLGTLVAGAGELGRLTPPVLRRVHAWLERGGTLLVDSAAGTPVEGLPDAWQPGEGGMSSAGLGRVRLMPGLVDGGTWDGVILPTPSRGTNDPRFGGFGGPTSVGNSLADDAGLRVPRISWLLGFLLAYTALVGPVLGFVLNRKKRAELAWVVVPLAAVLFAGGSYTAAKGLRSGTRLAHGSVIELSPAGASATSFVGVAARERHTTEVSLGDESWQAGRAVSGFDGGQRSDIQVTETGPATRLNLTAGQFAVASLLAPVPSPGDLVLTATSSEDGIVEGTIRNDLDTALEEVLVLVGRHGMNLGRLDPGEERQWRAAAGNVDNEHFPLAEMSLWRDASGQFGPPDRDSPVNFAVWQSSSAGGGVRPAGVATAVGWTREARLPIRIDGRPRSAKGSTAVTTSVAVMPQGRITDMTVRGEMVRGSNEAFGGADVGALGRVARFVLPEGTPVTRELVAAISAFAEQVEVWDGRGWVQAAPGPPAVGEAPGVLRQPMVGRGGPQAVPVPMPPPDAMGPMGPAGPEGPLVDVPIPASAVVAGSVFIRFGQNGPVGPGSLRLREAP